MASFHGSRSTQKEETTQAHSIPRMVGPMSYSISTKVYVLDRKKRGKKVEIRDFIRALLRTAGYIKVSSLLLKLNVPWFGNHPPWINEIFWG